MHIQPFLVIVCTVLYFWYCVCIFVLDCVYGVICIAISLIKIIIKHRPELFYTQHKERLRREYLTMFYLLLSCNHYGSAFCCV